MVLLLELQPLLPQPGDHLVVDADQGVHLRLPDLAEGGAEVALPDQLGAGADQVQGDEERPHQRDPHHDRGSEQHLDAQEQQRPLAHG
jgi:hypothetical protein